MKSVRPTILVTVILSLLFMGQISIFLNPIRSLTSDYTPNLQTDPKDKLVLAYYYGWYGNETQGWRHWDDPRNPSAVCLPQLGLYDSFDGEVADRHVYWAKSAGIDGFLVSWWNINGYEDNTTKLLFQRVNDNSSFTGFKLAIMVERIYISETHYWYASHNFTDQDYRSAFITTMEYIINSYFKMHPDVYLTFNGEPVIALYAFIDSNANETYYTSFVNGMKNAIYSKTNVTVSFWSLNTLDTPAFDVAAMYLPALQAKDNLQCPMQNTTYVSKSGVRVGSVFPGYDNINKNLEPRVFNRCDGKLYMEQWNAVLGFDPDVVFVTSWNEWHESTPVEPSVAWGNLYLRITRMYTSRLTDLNLNGKLRKAADFLNNTQYNITLNLCREAPNLSPQNKTYWLVSDNLLAYHALQFYYPDTATLIYSKMQEYGYFKSNCHESLFGETLPYIPFRNSTTYTVDKSETRIFLIDIYNGTRVMYDYQEYANLALYAALNAYWLGNEGEAVANFTLAKNVWDGKGIRDHGFTGLYETYKLALLIYVARVLNQTLEDKAIIENILWSMQDENGGIRTHYNALLDYSMSDVNTETTALTIIAYRINPLITKQVEVDGAAYTIRIRTNSTMVSERFNYNSTTFWFEVAGTGVGFCNITVPMNLNKTAYTVYVNGTRTPCNITSNSTHYFIHFTFTLNPHLATVRFAPEPPYTLTILVKDSSTNTAIGEVNVTVNGQWQLTNSTGYVVFSGLAPGNYTIAVSKDGYDSKSETVNVTGNTTYELTLNPHFPWVIIVVVIAIVIVAAVASMLLKKKRYPPIKAPPTQLPSTQTPNKLLFFIYC